LGRGGEDFLGTYRYLDIVPKGRDETGARGNLSDWVRHHDRYGATAPSRRPDAGCRKRRSPAARHEEQR